MKALINGTDNFLFFFFKLFSVAFTTAMLVEFSLSYYHGTNIYIAIALSVPFAWFYAFNYIGSLELAEKMVTILISGFIMMLFYLTLAEPIKKEFDRQALSALQQDIDYINLKEDFAENNYDPDAYNKAEREYVALRDKKVKHLNESQWKKDKITELNRIKKTDAYKEEVSEALLYRDATPRLRRLRTLTPLNSTEKVAYILFEKENDGIKQLFSPKDRKVKLLELKKTMKEKSRDFFKLKRAKIRAEYEALEAEAIMENSFSKTETTVFVLILGFLVEIALNAASFWRNLAVSGNTEEARINTMMTLLNKDLLMEKLAALDIVHEKGRNKGKVFALYATMINIIVLYKERDKKVFKRTGDITDSNIINFKYLDVNAKRHIPKVFEILADIDVKSLTMDDIISIIKEQKAK